MTETIPQKKNTRKFQLLGWLLAAVYGIMSFMAMNDLWKCYVDNNMGFFGFGDPERFCNSGMMYMYITLAALAGSLVFFALHWRRSGSLNWKFPAIIAGVLIIAGCFFLLQSAPGDMMFMDYIELKFYPFWCLTLAAFFVVKAVIVLTSKKS
jgi:hypothetical protein